MSEKTQIAKMHLPHLKKKIDVRVRRTRDALGDALVDLMQEKPFDSITVQDVLDRAQVGRSTFYSHYSDKNDLLMSDADEFFESIAMALSVHDDKSDRVFPVKEFFNRSFASLDRLSRVFSHRSMAAGFSVVPWQSMHSIIVALRVSP